MDRTGNHGATAPSPHHPPAEDGHDRPGAVGRAPARRQIAGLVLLASTPLLVALVAARRTTWFPTLDQAMFEMLVRDVGGPDRPLVGAYARVVVDGEQGSHLGPAGQYLMWPVYRLLGGTSWALQVATAWVHVLGIAVAVTIARRRGGPGLALAVTGLVVVLHLGFGPGTLVNPWNPYLAVFWWLAFVLAVWSVVDGDLPMAPVAVLAGSFCVQSHLEYVGPVACLGALALVAAVAHQLRARRGAEIADARRGWLAWAGWSVAVIAVMWAPTAWEQLTRDPGNLTLVVRQVSDGSRVYLGLDEGVATLLRNLDLRRLLSGSVGTTEATGSQFPGAALVMVWLLGAVTALLTGARSIVRLHLVLAVALVTGAVSMGRYLDRAWAWLGLWAPVLGGLTVVAILWSGRPVAARWWQDRRAGSRYRPAFTARAGAAGVGIAVVVVAVVAGSVQAGRAEHHAPERSRALADAVPAVVAAIESGSLLGPDTPPGPPDEARYAVRWRDPDCFGAVGYGLLNELDRRGYHVTADQATAAKVSGRRVVESARADAVIDVVVGSATERWRATPGVRELIVVDHRNAAERARYDQLSAEVVAELEAHGMDAYVEALEAELTIGVFDERVPDGVSRRVGEMLEIGRPIAIFVRPPDVTP